MENKTVWQKICYFPLTRIIVGIFVLSLVLYFVDRALETIPDNYVFSHDPENLIYAIVIGGVAVLTYYWLFRSYEKRKIAELFVRKIGRNVLIGVGIGFAIQLLTMLIIFIGGGYKIISVNNVSSILPGLSIGILAGTTEELIFRGILFRITEEKLGSIIALLLSAFIFGAIHLSNPHGSSLTILFISLEAGIGLGAAYIYSRSLWLPMAIHFAWNFSESGIFGVPDSGVMVSKSLITARLDGHPHLTGGGFGPEASVPCLVIGCTVAASILYVCYKQNKLIKPFWMKQPGQHIIGSSLSRDTMGM